VQWSGPLSRGKDLAKTLHKKKGCCQEKNISSRTKKRSFKGEETGQSRNAGGRSATEQGLKQKWTDSEPWETEINCKKKTRGGGLINAVAEGALQGEARFVSSFR